MDRKWYDERINKQLEIPEIKEFQRLQQFVANNLDLTNLEDLIPEGVILTSMYPGYLLAFPEEVTVGEVIEGPHGSDYESWSHSRTTDYFEFYVLPKLKIMNRDQFTKNFEEYLKATFNLDMGEYNELSHDEKVVISCQILIDLSFQGKIT